MQIYLIFMECISNYHQLVVSKERWPCRWPSNFPSGRYKKPTNIASLWLGRDRFSIICYCIYIHTRIVNYGDSFYQIALKLATELIASLRWVYGMVDIPSGNLTSLWKITINVVNCPMKNGDFPQLCKRLPEGDVGKTMPCLPSPSHHNFLRWHKPFPNGSLSLQSYFIMNREGRTV